MLSARPKPLIAPATGRSFPIGATLVAGGANFSVFFRSTEKIDLLLFDRADDARPSRIIPIDPAVRSRLHPRTRLLWGRNGESAGALDMESDPALAQVGGIVHSRRLFLCADAAPQRPGDVVGGGGRYVRRDVIVFDG